MVRFAHMADVHLGAFREPRLREANLEAFLKALDMCLEEKADFILICGDLFHTSLPDMGVVERAAGKLRQVIDAGMPVYVIYGSHDFSAAERSIVDVLHSAGVFVKVARASEGEDGGIRLEATVDEKSGAVIAGLSGRKLGLDKSYYEKLEAGEVLDGPGPKIFAFHAAITELKPKQLAEMTEQMPASLLPKGFDYYAGGHVHERMQAEMPGWGLVAYPGPLFGDGYRDLEGGEPRGFFMVHIEKGRPPQLAFKAVPARTTHVIEVDAGSRAPEDVNAELERKAGQARSEDAIVLIKVKGELSTGKASEVDTEQARKLLSQNGAFTVYVSRGGLSTKERAMVRVEGGEGRAEMETKLLRENLANHPSKMEGLKGEQGLLRARRLLQALSEEQKGMTRADHEAGVVKVTERVLFENAEIGPTIGKMEGTQERTVEVQGNAEPEKYQQDKAIEADEGPGRKKRSGKGGRGRQTRLG